uniref:Uncharacterized protein n=1 Tax=Solanum lycopersicum TaxID=4081 RepID=A0A3Q7HMN7_SOLLC
MGIKVKALQEYSYGEKCVFKVTGPFLIRCKQITSNKALTDFFIDIKFKFTNALLTYREKEETEEGISAETDVNMDNFEDLRTSKRIVIYNEHNSMSDFTFSLLRGFLHQENFVITVLIYLKHWR